MISQKFSHDITDIYRKYLAIIWEIFSHNIADI